MTDAYLFAAIAACGMAVQRGTGIGFSLLAVPLFSLLLGPIDGVLLANALSFTVNGLVLLATWPGLSPRILARFVPAGIVGVAPGAWTVHMLPESALYLLAGSIIALGALLVHLGPVQIPADRRGVAIGAAAISGFLNATSATGGAAMAVYAASTGWQMRSFIPNLQALNICLTTASLSVKGLPAVSRDEFLIATCGLALGVGAGAWLVRALDQRVLTQMALTVAFLGGLTAAVTGVAMI